MLLRPGHGPHLLAITLRWKISIHAAAISAWSVLLIAALGRAGRAHTEGCTWESSLDGLLARYEAVVSGYSAQGAAARRPRISRPRADTISAPR